MRKILITGGAGNIGSSLARELVTDSQNFVVIVDNLLTGALINLPASNFTNWKFIKADVNQFKEISTIMLRYKFDFVFHFAAVVGVKRTLENPRMVLDDINGIKNVLDLSKNCGVKKVFFSSSSEVYGEPVEIPQREDTTPLNSKLPYAVVKNLGEVFFRTYYQEYGLDYTIFRFFNTYGPNQSTDFVISKFIDLALQNKDLTIYGDGMQTRTFCYIKDNVDTMCAILNNNLLSNDVINIGSDEEITILDLAKTVIQTLGSKSRIIHLPPLDKGDMKRRCPDNTKMRQILNRPLISLTDGILLTKESFLLP